jgi:hypothetical protein
MTAYSHGWDQGGKVICCNDMGHEKTYIYADQGTNGDRQIMVAYIIDGKLYVKDRRGQDCFI